ncbi:MAG TPA: ferrous iron transport protein B [Bacteroidetes bacterium]|nr:ferrous iron transport protein B [Bacteroidota bacterium]
MGKHGSRRRRAGGGFGMILAEWSRHRHEAAEKMPTLRVALAGNPNSGKTSLFNALTGQHQHIGNYPGVTVEKKVGVCYHDGYRVEIVDLPGTYSLTAYSLEEVVTRDFVLRDKPDLIVDVIDSTNLERNLYLLLQLQELGVPVIGALNMSDEAEETGLEIDEQQLGKVLGVNFVKTVGHRGEGAGELLDLVVRMARGEAQANGRRLNYGRELERERETLRRALAADEYFAKKYNLDWVAIKLLEEDEDAARKVKREHRVGAEVLEEAAAACERIRKHFREDSVVVVGEQRYAYIHGAVREAVRRKRDRTRFDLTEQLDRFILNRYWGVLVFFLVMFIVYQLTFAIGNPLSDWIAAGFLRFGDVVRGVLPVGAVQDLVVDGVIGGVGGVITFFPLVLLLFFGLSFLEDSGYMARAAFVMDKFFHLFGLHGRSFIPFMIATGCAVPAVLSARTLVNQRDRKITILVTPLMVCGAKAPVIAMLAAAFFPKHAGFIFWLVWLAGWWIAFLVAYLFRKTLFRGDAAPFVMELPPYRLPTWRGILGHMWEKGVSYLRKAGTVILGISIIVWFLLYFPKPAQFSRDYEGELAAISVNLASLAEESGEAADSLEAALHRRSHVLSAQRAREELVNSYGGRIGRALEPLLKPAGFDWRIGVSLTAGFAAKEVIISTMGIVYGIGEADPNVESSRRGGSLRSRIAADPAYSPAMGLALMFFVLIYVPCMATLAVVRKEMGSTWWSVFLAAYTLLLAYGVAVAIYQLGILTGFGV